MTTPAATSAALAAFTNSPVFAGKSDIDQLLGFLYGSLLACIAVGLVFALWYFWPVIVKRDDRSTLKFFGFLRFTLGAWPWQESQEHAIWRNGWDKLSRADKETLAKHNAIYEPKYSMGFKNCGTAFDRTIGVKLTSRNVRLDLYFGILWITWRSFKVAKPAPEKAK